MGNIQPAEITLTEIERADFARCESQIRNGLHTFIEVGAALIEIRDKRLYREAFETFEVYVEARWNISRSRAYQLITAGLLSTRVDIQNERQARILKRLPEDMQPIAWDIARENSQRIAPDKPVSTRLLKATVNALSDAQATGGYVDTGDGEMTALDAAIVQDAHETTKRQEQHIRESTERREGVADDEKYTGKFAVVAVDARRGFITLQVDADLLANIGQGQRGNYVLYIKSGEPS